MIRPILLLISMLMLCALSLVGLTGCGETQATETVERADIITIDEMRNFGRLERPVVLFPHDLHTQALAAEGKSCETCHIKMENGKYAPLFKRVANTDYDTVMNLYHDACIQCHKETTGDKTGPVTCGECHRKDAKFISTWTEIGFNRSLHYRHEQANMEKCDHCHHVYDEQQKKLVYVKNQESSCRDCHKKEKIDNRLSLEQAAHYKCFGCHLENPETGPTTCAGCHDKQMQMDIKVVEHPARLYRNQPDYTYLSPDDAELVHAKLPVVNFAHIDHEQYLDKCRTCHHETMKACNECHLLDPGEDAVTTVTLQQAMHDMQSKHSCAGCHAEKKSQTQCAGCHALMEQGKLTDHACTICHSGPKPDELAKMSTAARTRKPAGRNMEKLSFRMKDIPDTVYIGRLSNKYEAAAFPHKKIIEKLMTYIGDSKIATYFHGQEDVVCRGCHHHTPVGETPPLCESCHTRPFNEEDLLKPGLFGAFHRQCLGCHEAMNITEPSDCVGCHAKKAGN
ncbi:MAG: cytochrome c3 family protein [Candidatus Zixiibacteriota bacterium]